LESLWTTVRPCRGSFEDTDGLRYALEVKADSLFEEVDLAPMFALNEIIWKSVRGADSEMPLPVHRYWFAGRSAQR
jgi:hypothetical protein